MSFTSKGMLVPVSTEDVFLKDIKIDYGELSFYVI